MAVEFKFLYWDDFEGKMTEYKHELKPNRFVNCKSTTYLSDPGDEQESIEDVHKPNV
jgi:hypothetical protein